MPVAPDAEITLEANPGTFEREKFAGFRAAGVNRLSLGVQSFNPEHLRALGRIHDENEARAAAESALSIFGNVNLDLMYALPRQTVDEARADAATAISFSPPHLSFYQLTLEPNTPFHRHPPEVPDEDAAADIENAVQATLADAGYMHYETSAHARAGYECRHNLNYWRFGDYLGIGAGAHSKLSLPDRIIRQVRYRQPKQYLERVAAGAPLMDNAEVSRDDIGFEFMLNALRLTSGVPATLFAERTGFPLAIVARGLEAATARGLIDADPTVIRPTALGRRFLNRLQGSVPAGAPDGGGAAHAARSGARRTLGTGNERPARLDAALDRRGQCDRCERVDRARAGGGTSRAHCRHGRRHPGVGAPRSRARARGSRALRRCRADRPRSARRRWRWRQGHPRNVGSPDREWLSDLRGRATGAGCEERGSIAPRRRVRLRQDGDDRVRILLSGQRPGIRGTLRTCPVAHRRGPPPRWPRGTSSARWAHRPTAR